MVTKDLVEYNISALHKYKTRSSGYSGITIFYVLKGNIHIKYDELSKTLYEGDILLINRNTAYKIESNECNIVLTLEVASYFFSRYYKNYFHCRYSLGEDDIPDFKKPYIVNIRLLLANIMISSIKESGESLLEINHLLSHLLLILVSFFQETNPQIRPTNLSYSRKIKNTIRFIETNYNKQISLKQAAENEYVSFSYLSRLFKKEVGVGFVQYLNNIKFEHAVYDLVNTKFPIYRIAEEHGFFDVKQFTQLFKKHYRTTPYKFRAKYQLENTNIMFNELDTKISKMEQDEHPVEVSALLPLLVDIINKQVLTPNEYASYDEQIIDLASCSRKETIPTSPYIIFIGELQSLLNENVKQQLLLLKKTAHVNYVEVSHLISGDSILPEFITDEPTPTYSPYYKSDVAISFLYKNDISLFIRIYHKSVASSLEAYTQKLIKFIQHYINLYGAHYVQKWKFIYYIEREHFNCTDKGDFTKCYNRIKEAMKSCLPKIEVGLFCPIINENGDIEDYNAQDIFSQVDFIGFSAKANNENINYHTIHNEVNYLQHEVKKIKAFLKERTIKVPLYLLQWNTLTGNTRHTNGSYFRGALLFNTLLALLPHVNGIGIVLNTEIKHEEHESNFIDIRKVVLFHFFNNKRPIFYVLKFLNKLKGKIIARSPDYLVTQSDEGYQLVITNVSVFNPHLSVEKHLVQNFHKRRLISLNGIKSGHYQIKRYMFDQKNGAVYRQYHQFQSKLGFDEEIIEYINRNNIPRLSVRDKYIANDKWETLAELDINAIYFYEFKRLE